MLLTSTGRAVSHALREGLTREGQTVWSPFTGSWLELVVSAIGCRTIVYTAGSSMLGGYLEPRPSALRVRQVLLAAAVPGVELVVGIVPDRDEYAQEEELLKSGDVPCVVLRCAPLVEELQAEGAGTHDWLFKVTTGEMLSTTVLRALQETSWRGHTVEVPTIRLQPAWRRAHQVTRQSLVPGSRAVPAFACLGCASWW